MTSPTPVWFMRYTSLREITRVMSDPHRRIAEIVISDPPIRPIPGRRTFVKVRPNMCIMFFDTQSKNASLICLYFERLVSSKD